MTILPSRGMIKVKYLEMGKLSWINQVGPILSQDPLIAEEGSRRGKQKRESEKRHRRKRADGKRERGFASMAGTEGGGMGHKPKNEVVPRSGNGLQFTVSKETGKSVVQSQETELYINLKKQETESSLEPPERNAPADSLILPHFCPTELSDNTYALLHITKLVVICDITKGN